MDNVLGRTAQKIFRKLGYQFRKYPPFGSIPIKDMKFFLANQKNPLILDIGANKGQSADAFLNFFPDATIHSFEPSPSTFQELKENCKDKKKVQAWNYGIGATQSKQLFLENTHSEMSSFLAPGESSWGNIERKTEVEVITLDSFTTKHNIDFVHALKTDTQGYDFEVLKGATNLMKDNKIALVFMEVIFSDMYKGQPAFNEIFQFLIDHNFSLVTFYDQSYQSDLLSWTDALFINNEFNKRN